MGMEGVKVEEEGFVGVLSIEPAQSRRVDPSGTVVNRHLAVDPVVLLERQKVDVLEAPGEAERR
jgi:hypothetical protein